MSVRTVDVNLIVMTTTQVCLITQRGMIIIFMVTSTSVFTTKVAGKTIDFAIKIMAGVMDTICDIIEGRNQSKLASHHLQASVSTAAAKSPKLSFWRRLQTLITMGTEP